jgi:hypothetical protein
MITRVKIVTCMEEMRVPYRVLVRKSEEKRRLTKLRRRWKNKIRMDLKEIG